MRNAIFRRRPSRMALRAAAGAHGLALALLLAGPALAAAPAYQCPAGLEQRTARALGYREATPHLDACRLLPAEPAKAVVALSYLAADAGRPAGEQEQGDYDLDLLVVDAASAKTLQRRRVQRQYTSDGFRFTGLAVDTARYQLAPAVRAFGLRAGHSTGSSALQGEASRLDLYVAEGGAISAVLSGLAVSQERGEWDGSACVGHHSRTERSIAVGAAASHGYADLLVTSKRVDSRRVMRKGECEEVAGAPASSVVTLRFDGQRYPVPAALRFEY